MTHAHAQADMADLPLEQLMQLQVTTASRYAQTALEAPATVSVVTADDIRLFGYRNLSEVLGSMRGLHVSYDRTYHYLGTRGFATPGDYNTRVLLLVNGVRFNDNLYDQATIGTDFPIDLDLVDPGGVCARARVGGVWRQCVLWRHQCHHAQRPPAGRAAGERRGRQPRQRQAAVFAGNG